MRPETESGLTEGWSMIQTMQKHDRTQCTAMAANEDKILRCHVVKTSLDLTSLMSHARRMKAMIMSRYNWRDQIISQKISL